MTRDQLEEFFTLPTCNEQGEFDELEAQAISYAIEGDAIMAAEMLVKAAQIVTDTLDCAKQGNHTNDEEIEQYDDSAEFLGKGGLW